MTKDKGYSLIEMVLYVTILSFMLAIIINMLVIMNKSVRQFHALKSVQTSGELSLERIVREVRNAESYVTASSTLNTSPGNLVLSGVDASSTTRTVEFFVKDNGVHMKENGVDLGSLTASDARVTNLVFRQTATPHSQLIRTEMTVESGTSTYYRSSKFYATAILRGSI